MSAGQFEAVELPVIRKSFRCFWLGAIGLIPGIGVVLAWQALRSFKDICAASGERPRVDFPIALLLAALLLNPLLHVGIPLFADIVASFVLVVIFAAWSCGEYFRVQPSRWNPARGWAWAGGVCGCIGLALSILALEYIYVSAY